MIIFSLFLCLFSCREGKDVIFLTVDTLRLDHVGVFSPSSPAITPNIDSLARDGIIYTQAYSPISVTAPAFITMHTGQDPMTHGVSMNLYRGGDSLAKDKRTLAQTLKASGYQTGAFVSGFTLHPVSGLQRGFDVYSYPINAKRRAGDKTAKLALEWLQLNKGPRFLWYHSYDPHGPLAKWGSAPQTSSSSVNLFRIPEYQRIGESDDPEIYKKFYARSVEFADRQIGKILDHLRKENRYDDALIVFTSDHGESFTERELWFDHGTHASEEQLHIPLIIKYPSGKKGDMSGLVGLKDVSPTVLDVLGKSPPLNADGKSLRAFKGHTRLFGESSHCKREMALNCAPHGPMGKIFSLRNTSRTLIHTARVDGTEILEYNRSSDPLELSPISQLIGKQEKQSLDLFVKTRLESLKNEPWPPKSRRKKHMKLLKELGYLDDQ